MDVITCMDYVPLNQYTIVAFADVDSLAVTIGKDIVANDPVACPPHLHHAVHALRATGLVSTRIEIAHAGAGADVILDDNVIDKGGGIHLNRGVVGKVDAAIANDGVAAGDPDSCAGAVLNREAIEDDPFFPKRDHIPQFVGQIAGTGHGSGQRPVRAKEAFMIAAVEHRLVACICFPGGVADCKR